MLHSRSYKRCNDHQKDIQTLQLSIEKVVERSILMKSQLKQSTNHGVFRKFCQNFFYMNKREVGFERVKENFIDEKMMMFRFGNVKVCLSRCLRQIT